MTGHDDAPPVRLEPHPADERLALLRVDRPAVNAFDQRMREGDVLRSLTDRRDPWFIRLTSRL